MPTTKYLHVVWNKKLVGTLQQEVNTDSIMFKYDEDWLSNQLPAISLSLPLQQNCHDSNSTKNFFGNLTPEGESLSDFSTFRRLSKGDLFSFLKHYGHETAGALSVFDPSNPPRADEITYKDVTQAVLENMSKPKHKQINLILATNAKMSLAGAQNKLPVCLKDDKILIPDEFSSAATTHIIKPPSTRFPNMTLNEAFCLDLARQVGLPVPDSRILFLEKYPVFVVARYDRFLDENKIWQRSHQEDFCQALNINKILKYQESGGPGFLKCTDLLLNKVHILKNEHGNFIKSVLYNFFIGNCDAHAKNYSLLYSINQINEYNFSATISLSPFYDLVSTLFYKELSKDMAMFFGRSKTHGLIALESIEMLLADLQVDEDHFNDLFEDLKIKIKQNIDLVIQKHIFDYGDSHIYNTLKKIINSNINIFSKQLLLFYKSKHSAKFRPG
ncbi:MAG: HipA domain-containing protein [Deltaproteobacteria bacterium]|jgi:serine/threonine-protein kinase HipA|nr:HipA domain-containing protein [Deltaproteobacteria bacterium]